MGNKKFYLTVSLGALVVTGGLSWGVSSVLAKPSEVLGTGNDSISEQNLKDHPKNGNPVGQMPMGPGWSGSFSPSAESISACSGKIKNDECSFATTDKEGNEKTLSGQCMISPKDKTILACMPKLNDSGIRGQNTASKLTEEKTEENILSDVDKVKDMKDRKSIEINRIESRVEKIVAFLKTKDINTSFVESNLATFKEKADAFLDEIDAYITLLENDDASSDDIKTELEAVHTAGKNMLDYFSQTLRASLRDAIDQLSE